MMTQLRISSDEYRRLRVGADPATEWATSGQLTRLRELGVSAPSDLTKAGASVLFDKLRLEGRMKALPRFLFSKPEYVTAPEGWALIRTPNSADIFLNGEWRDCSSEFCAYRAAKRRCENVRGKDWGRYGGRGILFKFASFQQFMNCVGLKLDPTLSLDRRNNDGHYEPGNVRWATAVEQANNRSRRTDAKI